MVLPSKSKKKKQTIQSVEEEKPLSKSEKRKLDQLNVNHTDKYAIHVSNFRILYEYFRLRRKKS